MSELKIATKNNQTAFRPGETIHGAGGWKLDRAPELVEVRLFWYTDGKGTQDIGIADRVVFEHAQPEEARPFSFTAPSAPVSFSGKIISLMWALELVVLPGHEAARCDLVISPAGREIVLETVPDESPRKSFLNFSRS